MLDFRQCLVFNDLFFRKGGRQVTKGGRQLSPEEGFLKKRQSALGTVAHLQSNSCGSCGNIFSFKDIAISYYLKDLM